jgi:hypothetical protein
VRDVPGGGKPRPYESHVLAFLNQTENVRQSQCKPISVRHLGEKRTEPFWVNFAENNSSAKPIKVLTFLLKTPSVGTRIGEKTWKKHRHFNSAFPANSESPDSDRIFQLS